MKIYLSLLLFALSFGVFTETSAAASVDEYNFPNPLIFEQADGCLSTNLRPDRFSPELRVETRLSICRAIDQTSVRLNGRDWSNRLKEELTGVWKLFCENKFVLGQLSPDKASDTIALTEIAAAGRAGGEFPVSIFIKKGITEKRWFYQTLIHELRHAFDYYQIRQTGENIPQIELERRALYLLSMLDQETPKNERYSKIKLLWREKWSKLEEGLLEYKRNEAIANFLKNSDFHLTMPAQLTEIPLGESFSDNDTPMDDKDYRPPRLTRRAANPLF